MANPLRRARAGAPEAPVGADWAAETADSIERVIVGIRSKTLDPLDRIVRILVYGIVGGALGVTAVVLLAVALVRAVDIAVPGDVWSADVTIGGIFTVVGLFLWTKRRAPGR